MSTQDSLRASAKSLGLIQHADKSDAELRDILLQNAKTIAGLPPQAIAQGYRLLGESHACNELLSRRKALREEIKSKKAQWKADLQKRRDDALLMLADEQETMIDRYLEEGIMYVLNDNGVKAECVVCDAGEGILEIKNLATDPKSQHIILLSITPIREMTRSIIPAGQSGI